MGLKVLPTLVGLSLWDCLALAFCTLIVSQLGRFVKGFLEIIFKKVACRKVGSYTASANSSTPSVGFPTPEVFPPLDTNILSHLDADYKMEYCTIVGFIICASLCDFLLDKLLAVWYNGNSRASHPGARRRKCLIVD